MTDGPHFDVYDLDAPLNLEELDPFAIDSSQRAHDMMRYLLWEMHASNCDALHMFVHEADHVIRSCLWNIEPAPRGTWYEAVPMAVQGGEVLLAQLRRTVAGSSQGDGAAAGRLICSFREREHTVLVESPHRWDVRLYTGGRRPLQLPYVLVNVVVFQPSIRRRLTEEAGAPEDASSRGIREWFHKVGRKMAKHQSGYGG